MTLEAQLPDGTKLQFPDGTDDEVIDRVVAQHLATQKTATGTNTPPPEAEPDPTLKDRMLEAIPQVGGGVVGGLAAAGAGAGLIPMAGAVALGAGAGEAYRQIGQHIVGSPDAPATSMDAAKRIAKAGLEEGAWETIGGLAAKGFRKVLAPYKNRMVEGAEDVVEMFKGQIKPVVLLPHEATESRALDLIGNISESSIIGGSTISKYKTARGQFFDEFADSLIDEFGERTDPTDLGNLFVASIERSRDTHAKASEILYNNVGRALDRYSKGANQAVFKRVSDVVEDELEKPWNGIIYRAGEVREGGSFFAFTEDYADFYSGIHDVPVQAYKVNDLGKLKILDAESKEIFDLAGTSEEEFVEQMLDYHSVIDDAVIALRDKGYDSVLLKNVETDGYEGVELVITNPSMIEKVGAEGVTSTLPTIEKGVQISTDSLKSFAKHPRKIAEDLGGIEAKNAGDDLMAAVMDLPDTISFEAAKDLRSRLISRVNEFQVINKKAPAIGKAKKLISLVDSAIESGLKDLPKPEGGMRFQMPKAETMESGFMGKDAGRAIPAVRYNGEIYTGEWGAPHFDVAQQIPGEVDFSKIRESDRGWMINGQYVGRVKDKATKGGVDEWTFTDAGPLEAWRIANRFYKEGQERFNNTMIRRLIKLASDNGVGAEMIAPSIFKPGQVSRVRSVKRALGESSPEWNSMRQFFVQHLLSKSTDVNGQIVGKRILNNISGKPNSFGMEMMRETLTPAQIHSLKTFGRAAQIAQEAQSEGAGRVLIQLTQAGAMGAIVTGKLEIPAATIVFGPAVLSKLLLRPSTSRFLTEGLTLPASAEAAGGILARLTRAAHDITQDQEKSQ